VHAEKISTAKGAKNGREGRKEERARIAWHLFTLFL
jgi:hypothetical protein